MKEETKIMRLVMEDLKLRLTKCISKNTPSCLPYCDSDKELIGKIKAIDETISFFENQKEGMQQLVSTSTHKAYIRKITSWIIYLKCLKSECIATLNDRRAAKGCDDQHG